MAKLYVLKEGKWVHATKQDVARYQPWLLPKGAMAWVGDKWTPIVDMLKEDDKNV